MCLSHSSAPGDEFKDLCQFHFLGLGGYNFGNNVCKVFLCDNVT